MKTARCGRASCRRSIAGLQPAATHYLRSLATPRSAQPSSRTRSAPWRSRHRSWRSSWPSASFGPRWPWPRRGRGCGSRCRQHGDLGGLHLEGCRQPRRRTPRRHRPSMRTAPGLMRVISGVWPGRMPSSLPSPGRRRTWPRRRRCCSSAETTSTWNRCHLCSSVACKRVQEPVGRCRRAPQPYTWRGAQRRQGPECAGY